MNCEKMQNPNCNCEHCRPDLHNVTREDHVELNRKSINTLIDMVINLAKLVEVQRIDIEELYRRVS